jgi:hypothetical protein
MLMETADAWGYFRQAVAPAESLDELPIVLIRQQIAVECVTAVSCCHFSLRDCGTCDNRACRFRCAAVSLLEKLGASNLGVSMGMLKKSPATLSRSKYPPAEPGALGLEPLKAAYGAADAAPERVGHLKVAISATDSSAPGACPPLPVS